MAPTTLILLNIYSLISFRLHILDKLQRTRNRLTCVRSFVYVESRLLRESLEADVALVGALAGVRAVVDLEVLLAGEGGGALQALEGPALHCKHTGVSGGGRGAGPRRAADVPECVRLWMLRLDFCVKRFRQMSH